MRVRVRQVEVIVGHQVSLQGMNLSQCNVLKSHENMTVCVRVFMYLSRSVEFMACTVHTQ